MQKKAVSKLFALLILLFAGTLAGLALSSHTGSRLLVRYRPLVNVMIDLRYEVTHAHLWLEETVSGDPNVQTAWISQSLEKAHAAADVMLKGGDYEGMKVLPVDAPAMEDAVDRYSLALEEYQRGVDQRLADPEQQGTGSGADEAFDATYLTLIDTIDACQQVAQRRLDASLRFYQWLQSGLLAFLAATAVLAFWLNRHYQQSLNKMTSDVERRERLYRNLVETQPGVVFSFTGLPERSGMDYISPQVEELTGYSAQALLSGAMDWPDLIHPEDRKQALQDITRCVEAGKPFFAEFRILRSDGETRWVRDTAQPVQKYDSDPPLYLGVLTDITRESEALLEQKRLETILHKVFETIPDPIVVLDADRNLVLHNVGTKEELSDTSKGIAAPPAHPCYEILMDRHDFCEDCPLEKVFETGKPVSFEKILGTNQHTYEIHALPITDSNGQTSLVVEYLHDVTAIRQSHEENLKMERQIQQTQKLESLGVLAGGIAHDFNNILMAIIGNADMAMEELSPYSPARENLDSIETAARKAADLSRQMLAYSGRGHFTTQIIQINSFVSDMAHMLNVSISKKAVLKYNFADGLPPIKADMNQLRQVIMNLIINASEAIGERSGIISLNTGVMECDRAYLDSSNPITGQAIEEPLAEGLYTYFEVTDTGCGMDLETQEKMFDPFYTTKFTGRGLGMSAVIGILRGHRATIRIYSEPKKGTSIKVLFPAVAGGLQLNGSESTDAGKSKQPPMQGQVLLVDDEEPVRTICKRMLESFGLQVLQARDGRECVDIFRKQHEEIDLVLLDLMMPHLSGDQAFTEMRRISQNVRVILASGYNESDATQMFKGKQLFGFIQKPYSKQALEALIRPLFEENVSSA